jgi:hypothetical protein
VNRLPIADLVKAYRPGPGRHWFDADSIQFFRTRLPKHAFPCGHGVYFVTSEQCGYFRRGYSVRRFWEGRIQTVGEFNSYPSRKSALRAMRIAMEGGVA